MVQDTSTWIGTDLVPHKYTDLLAHTKFSASQLLEFSSILYIYIYRLLLVIITNLSKVNRSIGPIIIIIINKRIFK